MTQLLHQLRWALPLWLIGLLTNWWPENRVSCRVRGAMARPFVRQCGERFLLGSGVTLLNTKGLSIGDDVYLARGTWINAIGGLTIEDEVMLAPYVVISKAQHVFSGGSARFGGSIARPVVIGRGSWLAAHVVVKCGVRIGGGSLIAANSAVVEDTPEGSILGGVPARVIGRNLDGEAEFHTRAEFQAGLPHTP